MSGPLRVWVTGPPGAGKTTLSRELARTLGHVLVELDGLYWGPGWQARPIDQFRREVAAVAAGERWILDGHYSGVHDLIEPRVDTFVWLDAPLSMTLPRVLRRTARRVLSRTELWSGNVQSVRALWGPDSILTYTVSSRRQVHDDCARLLPGLRKRGVTCHHIRVLSGRVCDTALAVAQGSSWPSEKVR
jgi:adenylate kinase family enzyme